MGHNKVEEDKEAPFEQFTQCFAFRYANAIQGSKVGRGAGGRGMIRALK